MRKLRTEKHEEKVFGKHAVCNSDDENCCFLTGSTYHSLMKHVESTVGHNL